MQASTTAETIHFFHSVFSWWDYLLSNDLLDSIYRILSGTNMWSKLHCQRKKISLTVSTPVQLDDCWEEYLRESWSVRAVSELSVWDCRVIIKEVAQCHSHPQAVFFFLPRGRQHQLGNALTSRAELRYATTAPLQTPSGLLKGRLSHSIAFP